MQIAVIVFEAGALGQRVQGFNRPIPLFAVMGPGQERCTRSDQGGTDN